MFKRSFLQVFIFLWLCPFLRLSAQEMPVPIHVQAQLFKKIFGYLLSVQNPSNPSIVIIEPTAGAGEAIEEAFKKVNLTQVRRMTAEEFIASEGKGFEIGYVCPENKTDKLKKIFVSAKILSISGVVQYYDKGMVSVSLNAKNNKTQILINADRTRTEGHRFSANFLKMTQGG